MMGMGQDSESGPDEPKPVEWVGSSRKDLRRFPTAVKSTLGYALDKVQVGRIPSNVKPLKGFGGAGVLEIRADDLGGTYRAVYTVKFADVIYVLHAFQ